MAATVDADHAIAMLDEEQHLGVPVVGAERPAMMEDDRLALAPVLVEDLCAVVGCDRAHGFDSVCCEWKYISRGPIQVGRRSGRLVAKATMVAELAGKRPSTRRGCCAHAASGHAAALPSAVINSSPLDANYQVTLPRGSWDAGTISRLNVLRCGISIRPMSA